MTTNSPAIACDCENDPRLLAGIAAIAHHVAKQSKWNSEAQDKLGETTENLCRKVFSLSKKNGGKASAIRLICAPFQDRIEVSVEFPGEVAVEAFGLDEHGSACREPKAQEKDVVPEGRVRYETINGRSRLTLLCHDYAASKPKA